MIRLDDNESESHTQKWNSMDWWEALAINSASQD